MIVGVSDISINRSLPLAWNLTVESDFAAKKTLLCDVFYNGSEPLVFIWYSNLRNLSSNENLKALILNGRSNQEVKDKLEVVTCSAYLFGSGKLWSLVLYNEKVYLAIREKAETTVQ